MFRQYSAGSIEIIVGPMFSGKTDELIRRLSLMQYGPPIKYLLFKPKIDSRFGDDKIYSRIGTEHAAITVENVAQIKEHLDKEVKIVAIEEVQFFDEDIVEFVRELANSGKRVILSGLDMDFKGRPFGSVPLLLAEAEFITKLTATCVKCGKPATRSYRIKNKNDLTENTIEIGDKELYEPKCRSCFNKSQ